MVNLQKLFPHLIAGLLFLVLAAFFRTIILDTQIVSDFNAHIGFAKNAFDGNTPWPRHFLYFWLVTLTSFWSDEIVSWEMSGWTWLSVLVVMKYYAVLWFLDFYTTSNLPAATAQTSDLNQKNKLIGSLISLCLVFIFCFPQPRAYFEGLWYAYSFPPNTWHNSTQIALMPFAIVLFGLSVRQLQEPEKFTRSLLTALVAVLSAFAKPSFLMAWVPAYGLCLLFQFMSDKSIKRFAINATPIALGLLVVLAQYYFIYVDNINNTSIQFGYLEAWQSRVDRLPSHFYISIFFSSLFPIVFYAFNRTFLTRIAHVLSILIVIIAYLFAMMFSEAGAITAGNFMWPIISANFISYMLCSVELFGMWKSKRSFPVLNFNLKVWLPGSVFLLSTIWGIAYMARYISSNSFA